MSKRSRRRARRMIRAEMARMREKYGMAGSDSVNTAAGTGWTGGNVKIAEEDELGELNCFEWSLLMLAVMVLLGLLIVGVMVLWRRYCGG